MPPSPEWKKSHGKTQHPLQIDWSKATEKMRAAEESLATPEEREHYRKLVEDIYYQTVSRGWAPYRQWSVLAELVRQGWRRKG